MLNDEQRELVEKNIKLAYKRGRHWSKVLSWDLEDCVSIASYGLVKAVATHDPSKGYLSTLAYRIIDNEIYKEIVLHKAAKRQARIVSLDKNTNEKQTIQSIIGVNDQYHHDRIVQILTEHLNGEELRLFEQVYIENVMQKDIAEAKGVTKGAIGFHVKKLKAKIWEILFGGDVEWLAKKPGTM